jgi:prepilin-type N-terminal cleavage/methylation domain-containing protein
MVRLFFNRHQSRRGDTIIEVLLSIAILSIVLGTAFVSSNHSLQNGVDAGNRNKALSYSQEQIEFMKNTAYQNPTLAGTYRVVPSPFCIDTSDGQTAIISTNPQYGTKCKSYRGSQYSIKIDYNNGPQVFTVTTNWDAPNGSGQDELKLYYKLP